MRLGEQNRISGAEVSAAGDSSLLTSEGSGALGKIKSRCRWARDSIFWVRQVALRFSIQKSGCAVMFLGMQMCMFVLALGVVVVKHKGTGEEHLL